MSIENYKIDELDSSSGIFKAVFEICSAYGSVGLSIGSAKSSCEACSFTADLRPVSQVRGQIYTKRSECCAAARGLRYTMKKCCAVAREKFAISPPALREKSGRLCREGLEAFIFLRLIFV